MNILLWVMLVFLFAIFVRLVICGASIWDKLLGMSVSSIKIILIIILYASANEAAYVLDFAIIYALFGFIGIILIALFLAERTKRNKN